VAEESATSDCTATPRKLGGRRSHLDAALAAVDQERLSAVRKTFSDAHFNARVATKDIQDRIDLIDSNLKRMTRSNRSTAVPGL